MWATTTSMDAVFLLGGVASLSITSRSSDNLVFPAVALLRRPQVRCPGVCSDVKVHSRALVTPLVYLGVFLASFRQRASWLEVHPGTWGVARIVAMPQGSLEVSPTCQGLSSVISGCVRWSPGLEVGASAKALHDLVPFDVHGCRSSYWRRRFICPSYFKLQLPGIAWTVASCSPWVRCPA